ncbi:MAG: ABC transporter permease [Chloroflexota bacterium]
MNIWIITSLTIQETQRRRILWTALLMGLGLLALFGLGFHYIFVEFEEAGTQMVETTMAASVLLSAGLYVANFLIVVMAVLISVTAIAGEVETHTVETILTKPIRRWEWVLGKWVAFALLLSLYVLLLGGGMMLVVYARSGFVPANIAAGMSLMLLQGLTILSLTIVGGTRLSTLTNGVVAFMLYGVAFIGGWVEQIGAIFRNETAVDIGIAASLIMPGDVLWKKAMSLFLPDFTGSVMSGGPFAVTSQPSDLMIVYALAYTLALLLLALWSFSRRDL